MEHTGLVIRDNPEGAQRIISAYTEKKETWEKKKKNTYTTTNPRGQYSTSSKIAPLLPSNAKPPNMATTHPNYWGALGLDSDDDTEFRSEIDLNHPQ